MMENEQVAKFFIGTLLEQEIVAVEVKPQEFTWMDDLHQDDPKVQQYINAKLKERLSINIYRVDFIATIKTEAGEYKKILIEIQKAKNQIDLMRFRRYLGEQYKKEDQINNEKTVLPITTIYILGFTLPDIETACIRVERNYKDLINKTIIEKKSDFVEKLTHDSYIVQVDRITNRFQTRLDKLLSVFEQSNFIDDRKIIKQFPHPTDTEDVKILTDILHHSGSDPDERKRIEDEQEAWRTINAMFGHKEEAFLKALQEKDNILHEKNKALDEKNKALDEKDKALDEKNRLNADLLQQLEELKRKLGER